MQFAKYEELIATSYPFAKSQSLFQALDDKATFAPARPMPCLELPNEIILQIFGHLVSLPLKTPFNSEAIRPLLFSAQVCQQWRAFAHDCLVKIYRQVMGEEISPSFSCAHLFYLLHQWKKYPVKISSHSLAPLAPDPFESTCHLKLENPSITYDKVCIHAIYVVLGPTSLVAAKLEKADKGEGRFKPLWWAKIKNPTKRIFISTDQKLIATQHISLKQKQKTSLPTCSFQVRSLQTGYLLGKIKIREGFSPFMQVKFDLTKFIYHLPLKGLQNDSQ